MVWLGKHLQQRGHEVVMVTAPLFAEVARKAGIAFRGVGMEEEYQQVVNDPRLWNRFRAPEVVFGASARVMERFFEVIREEVVAGAENGQSVVLLAPFQMPAARLAREVLKVPLVTVHLQPIAMFSAHDEVVLMHGMEWFGKLPVWMKRLFWRLPNPALAVLGREVKRLCGKHGLEAPGNWLLEWTHSPDGVLCLWPEWFAKRQPDWPAQAKAVGFPLEDLKGHFVWPEGLQEFLEEGEPPVLLTAGTGNAQAREFFEAGMQACERLGKRILLGTTFREQLPEQLPPQANWFKYLPFGELLPKVGAIVHHGGIGTMSQAFAAGVPQVVVPLAHDQPDNASRMERLGTGKVAWRLGEVEGVLRKVLGEQECQSRIRQRCREVAGWSRSQHASDEAVTMLEDVAARGCHG